MRSARHHAAGPFSDLGALLVLLCMLPVVAIVGAYVLGWPVPRWLVGLVLSLCLVTGVLTATRYGRRRSRWP